MRKLMLLLCLAASYARPASDSEDWRSLQAIKSVTVVVEAIEPAIESALGLSRATIITDAELKLRQAGIPVLESNADAALLITVDVLLPNNRAGIAGFNYSVSLNQRVVLYRDGKPFHEMLTATWRRSQLGTAATNKLSPMRQHIKDIIDMFLNDYLKANPKSR